MEIIFFSFLFLTAYSYFFYPPIAFIFSRLLREDWHKKEIHPPATLIISVYNEEEVVREKLRNSLNLEYPKGHLQIIVSSDGSTDRTHAIVNEMKDPRVCLRAFGKRQGKTACLNHVIAEDARGEIVVFTDANSFLPADALKKMVRNFADDRIGAVTGWTKYLNGKGGEETTGIYAKLEKVTKYWESFISSCVGADGAIFAIRKALYRPLENRDINDFVIPLNVIEQARRVVLDPEVFCFENGSSQGSGEFHRQARITNRTLGAIFRNVQFLNPLKVGKFSFLLWSHKLLRFLVPLFLLGALVMNLVLVGTSGWYWIPLAGLVLFLTLGFMAVRRPTQNRLANLAKIFVLTISAQTVGWIRFLRGKEDTTWAPQR